MARLPEPRRDSPRAAVRLGPGCLSWRCNRPPLLRGLGLQLVLRRDDIEISYPGNIAADTLDRLGRTQVRYRADVCAPFQHPALCCGAALPPARTPNLKHLQEQVFSLKTGPERDPRRDGRLVADGGPFP